MYADLRYCNSAEYIPSVTGDLTGLMVSNASFIAPMDVNIGQFLHVTTTEGSAFYDSSPNRK